MEEVGIVSSVKSNGTRDVIINKENSFCILLIFILFSYSNNILSDEFSYKDFLNNLSSFKSKFKQNLLIKKVISFKKVMDL